MYCDLRAYEEVVEESGCDLLSSLLLNASTFLERNLALPADFDCCAGEFCRGGFVDAGVVYYDKRKTRSVYVLRAGVGKVRDVGCMERGSAYPNHWHSSCCPLLPGC